jgi:dethiobiotin synthetase
MHSGLFVTGTDTNVGKTVASAALVYRYRENGVHYWKPIQTGTEQDDDTAEVQRLTQCEERLILRQGVRLPQPVSPHLAARLNGQPIHLRALFDTLHSQAASDPWIIEGAGGAMVPVNETQLLTDMISLFGLPALIVARTSLGTINHTLLTIDALRSRSIRIAGVLMVGDPDVENRAAIEKFGKLPVFGQMPRFDPLTPEAMQTWVDAEFDREGKLAEYLR